MRNDKRKTIRRPDVRSLKIQPKTRFNEYSQKDVPEIKLCGNWLQNLGFQYGTRVTITSTPILQLAAKPAPDASICVFNPKGQTKRSLSDSDRSVRADEA
jgi:hypothetical protein